jgi:hypothetical protein
MPEAQQPEGMMDRQLDDIAAIRAVIARQFESLNWTGKAPADWAGFAGDFLDGATLFPAARPAAPQSVAAFVERMKALSRTSLQSFHESFLGSAIQVFGNIAVAVAAVEITENDTQVSRSIEMMLLVKSNGAWRIASQAWDKASDANPIPQPLLIGRQDY